MAIISEAPSNQDIFVVEKLVPRSRAQFNFVFIGSEILLETISQHLSHLLCVAKKVSLHNKYRKHANRKMLSKT